MVRGTLFCALVVLACPAYTAAASVQAAATGARGRLDDARALAGAGRHKEALAVIARAVPRVAQAGDRASEAEAELLRSSSLRAIADRPAALASAERALTLSAAADLQVRALTQIARLHSDDGQETKAAEVLQRAWTIAGRAGDATLTIQVGEARAANARARGNGADAARAFADVIEAADRAGSLDYRIRGRTGRSSALLGLGRFDEALVDGERAYALAASAPVRLRASATFALAQVHAHLWNLDRAAQLWDQAVSLYREAGLQIGVALSHRQAMDTWFALRDFDRALKEGSAALALYETAGSQGSLPDTLARLALIQARRGDAAASVGLAARARAASEGVPARRLVFIENDLGLVELYGGRPEAAGALFERVRATARAQGDVEYEWRGSYGLGRAALAAGRPSEAQAHLRAAADLVERMRRALPAPEQRATFMSQRVMVHDALIEALMARSTASGDWYARRAFDVAETARARALADQMAETSAREADSGLRRIAAQEAAASRHLSSIQKSLHDATEPPRREALAAQLARAEQEYESLAARARRENPRRASMAWPQPITAAGAARLLAEDEALVEFTVGDQGGWAWALRAGQLVTYPIPSAREVDDIVRRVRRVATSGEARGLRDEGAAAVRMLLEPAAHLLRGARRLIIVPHGALHRMPFAALPGFGGGWLIETHALSVAPSATVLGALRAQPVAATRRLLAFAAPAGRSAPGEPRARGADGLAPLINAEAEAREAARLAAGDSAVRVPAREEDVKHADAGGYRVLHFAAHALVDERVPRRSAIVLAPGGADDGLLQVNEIPHLRLDAQLVVLAACRSQMGRAMQGEGLLSLSRAFLHGGARAVVASLWDVSDADSRRLMQAFYRHVRTGVPSDEALRRAQIELTRMSGSPARWSAFVVSGDARVAALDPAPETWRAGDVVATAGALMLLLVAAGAVWIDRRGAARSAAVPAP